MPSNFTCQGTLGLTHDGSVRSSKTSAAGNQNMLRAWIVSLDPEDLRLFQNQPCLFDPCGVSGYVFVVDGE